MFPTLQKVGILPAFGLILGLIVGWFYVIVMACFVF